jgi:aminoglycoside phosphotransferase (APT) family kinase protein
VVSLGSAHRQLAASVASAAAGYPDRAWRSPLAIVHGDFRVDNIFFSGVGKGNRATIVDWQWIRVGPPLIDVCLLLGGCFVEFIEAAARSSNLAVARAAFAQLEAVAWPTVTSSRLLSCG